jgi:hypothetical protein
MPAQSPALAAAEVCFCEEPPFPEPPQLDFPWMLAASPVLPARSVAGAAAKAKPDPAWCLQLCAACKRTLYVGAQQAHTPTCPGKAANWAELMLGSGITARGLPKRAAAASKRKPPTRGASVIKGAKAGGGKRAGANSPLLVCLLTSGFTQAPMHVALGLAIFLEPVSRNK